MEKIQATSKTSTCQELLKSLGVLWEYRKEVLLKRYAITDGNQGLKGRFVLA